MWRNQEVLAFADWLRGHNASLAPERQAGMWGLDVYSLRESMHAVIRYLEVHSPQEASEARRRYSCRTEDLRPHSLCLAAYGSGFANSPRGRSVIVVDDGIATCGTVKAALKGLRSSGAAHIALAVPVAPRSAIAELEDFCDEIVCLSVPEPFYAVGAHCSDFSQTEDNEVVALLARARDWMPSE